MRAPPPLPAPKVSARASAAHGGGLELPSVLLVGAPTAYQAALAGTLDGRGHFVELAQRHALTRVAATLAPDLVVLLEDSARDCGTECLEQMARVRACAPIPVLVLAEPEDLAQRLQAYRLGARAVMRRPASVDAAAAAISRLLRALPGPGLGELEQIGEVTLEELARAFSNDLRRDVLGAIAPSEHEPPVRLLLDEHEPVLSLISEFVQRLRPHVVSTDDAAASAPLSEGTAPPLCCATRVLLVDDDATRADVVAQELRARGLRVLVTSTDPPQHLMHRARELAPQAIVIDAGCLAGERTRLLRLVWRDVQLRWASLVAVRWRDVWPDPLRPANISTLLAGIAEATAPDRLLAQRVQSSTSLTVRLEVTGPGRLLRAIADAPFPLRVRVSNRRVEVQLDVANRLLAGATARAVEGSLWVAEGPPALATFLQIGSGRVLIERVENPGALNVLCPIDLAFAMAQSEPAPIRASGIDDFGPFQPPSAADDASRREGAPLESDRPTAVSARPFVPRRDAERSVEAALPGPRARFVARPGVRRALLVAALALPPLVSLALLSLHAGQARPAARSRLESSSVNGAARNAALAASGVHRGAAEPSGPAPAASAPSITPPRFAAPPLAKEAETQRPSCAELEKSLPELTGDALATANRAVVLGDLAAAQGAYCRASSLAPEQVGPALGLTRVLLMQGDGRGALASAEHALELAPGSRVARELLGDALLRSGEPERARAAWFQAAAVNGTVPREVTAWLAQQRETARRAAKGQRHELAERACLRVLGLEPRDFGAALCVSRALVERNARERARDWAEFARTLAGHDPRKVRQVARLLEDTESSARRPLARRAARR